MRIPWFDPPFPLLCLFSCPPFFFFVPLFGTSDKLDSSLGLEPGSFPQVFLIWRSVFPPLSVDPLFPVHPNFRRRLRIPVEYTEDFRFSLFLLLGLFFPPPLSLLPPSKRGFGWGWAVWKKGTFFSPLFTLFLHSFLVFPPFFSAPSSLPFLWSLIRLVPLAGTGYDAPPETCIGAFPSLPFLHAPFSNEAVERFLPIMGHALPPLPPLADPISRSLRVSFNHLPVSAVPRARHYTHFPPPPPPPF